MERDGVGEVSLDLAREAGIRVPDSQLLRISDRSVLIVDRFDRIGARRIGYASAMTMVEGRDHDVGSYLDIGAVIEQTSRHASDDLRELWRRIAFSILISNTDDHLRNHGFLREVGAWRLSPAFDINPDPAPGPKQLSTAIDGYSTEASIDVLMSVAELFRLTDAGALMVLREVLVVTSRWRLVAETHGLSEAEIAEMAWAFEHAQTDSARAL